MNYDNLKEDLKNFINAHTSFPYEIPKELITVLDYYIRRFEIGDKIADKMNWQDTKGENALILYLSRTQDILPSKLEAMSRKDFDFLLNRVQLELNGDKLLGDASQTNQDNP
ncbi:MAG: hypothetical protein GY750_21200 [Lentisphaerae bacterium]|nr:hypothetical protein [Lentisphaerota bacterium]